MVFIYVNFILVYGCYMDIIWMLYGYYMDYTNIIWILHGCYMYIDIIWIFYGYNMGYYMDDDTLNCMHNCDDIGNESL